MSQAFLGFVIAASVCSSVSRAAIAPGTLDRYKGRVVSLEEIVSDLKVPPSHAFKAVLAQEKVVIDLFATWCDPCKRLAPEFAKMAQEFSDVLFVKIDTEAYPEISNMYGVRSIPTIIFLKQGTIADRVSGADKKKIRSALNKLF